MKTLLVAALLSTSFFGAAVAADVAPAISDPAPGRWDGPYLGVHGGYAWGRSDVSAGPNTLFNDWSQGYDGEGGMFGAFAGWNFQAGDSPWVWGVEADLSSANLAGRSAPVTHNPFIEDSYRTHVDWLATLRGRLGYSWDNSLVYATSGLAYGELSHGYVDTGILFPGAVTAKARRTGYTVGAGWEHAFAGPWAARLEYGYVNFGRRRLDVSPNFNPDFKSDFHMVKAGISYRFGRP